MNKIVNDDPKLIAIDWGTTNCRAWLLGEDATILDSQNSANGTLQVSGQADPSRPGDREKYFELAFQELCGEWIQKFPTVPVVASGMVGSNQGWKEAEYLSLPGDVNDLGTKLVSVAHAHGTLHIIPGLFNPGGTVDSTAETTVAAANPPDVIRGEEVQILGCLASLSEKNPYLLLPGTHTKWVKAENRVVTDFVTSMSGELYSLVMNQSIVGRLAEQNTVFDEVAFRRGLKASATLGAVRGLGAALFSGRTLAMDNQLTATEIPDYVSGLIIGDEVNHLSKSFTSGSEKIYICGADQLAARYSLALAENGIETIPVPADISIQGIWQIAQSANILAQPEEALA